MATLQARREIADNPRLRWDFRIGNEPSRTMPEYQPQIPHKWWSNTSQEWKHASPSKHGALSNIGRIMETELGKKLVGRDMCKGCRERGWECWVYSNAGMRQVKYSTPVCARCRTGRREVCSLRWRRMSGKGYLRRAPPPSFPPPPPLYPVAVASLAQTAPSSHRVEARAEGMEMPHGGLPRFGPALPNATHVRASQLDLLRAVARDRRET